MSVQSRHVTDHRVHPGIEGCQSTAGKHQPFMTHGAVHLHKTIQNEVQTNDTAHLLAH